MRRNITFLLSLAITTSAYGVQEVGDVSAPLEVMSGFQPAEVGDRWVYRDNLNSKEGYIEVIESNGDATTWKDSLTDCKWTRDQDFGPSIQWENCGGSSGKQVVELKGEIWPLSKDTEFQFKVRGSNDSGQTWKTTVRCEVEDELRVRTAAGEFDTYKLVCSDNWNTRIRYVSPKEETIVAYQRKRKKRGLVDDNDWIRSE